MQSRVPLGPGKFHVVVLVVITTSAKDQSKIAEDFITIGGFGNSFVHFLRYLEDQCVALQPASAEQYTAMTPAFFILAYFQVCF